MLAEQYTRGLRNDSRLEQFITWQKRKSKYVYRNFAILQQTKMTSNIQYNILTPINIQNKRV